MAFLKVCLVLSALVAASCGKVVRIKNGHSTDLMVSVDGSDYTVLSNALVAVTLADEWSGSITAVPVGAEIVDGPRTSADLSLSAAGDSYSVNLVNGFNLGVKIIPTNTTTLCTSPVCTANLLNVCPVANQVTNSLGTVVACQLSPLVFSTICPSAVVDVLTVTTNVHSCTASSYLVLFV